MRTVLTDRPAVRTLVLAALMILVLAGCGEKKQAPRETPAVPVLADVAATRDVPIVVTAIGTVEPFQTVTIKTLVGGELTRVAFREGQEVRRGDLLFTIDPRPYQAALAQAQANLARDRAQFENARVEQKRNADLVAKEYITREQFDRSVTSTASLEATIQADQAMVDNARVQLSYCTIRSPIDGRVGKLLVYQGAILKSNDTSLVTINQVRPINVAFSVPESNLPEIRRRDAEGRLTVEASPQAEPDRVQHGSLAFVDNSVDRSTGTILLKAVFKNDDGALWPGQFVTVRLNVSLRAGAVTVPTQALQTGQAGLYVFVIKPDDTVEMRPVTTGPVSGDATVIEKGLAAGERVVTDGQLRLLPDSRVEIKTAAAGNGGAGGPGSAGVIVGTTPGGSK